MRHCRLFLAGWTLTVGVALSPAWAQTAPQTATHTQPSWKLSQPIALGGTGSWDYLTVDPDTHRLFIPRTTHTMVVDAATGKLLADIPGQKSAHGVALAPQLGRGFISDGGGAILIFDLKTYAVLGKINSEKDSDGIIFDPRTGRVLVVSGDGGDLMAFPANIDPKHAAIETTIPLAGAPEFLATDASGKVYINLMDKNVVAVVDLAARKVIARWSVAPGGAPVGMAIDEQAHRLIVGCRKPQAMVILSTLDGKVMTSMPIGEHVDAIKMDAGNLFASCGDGTLTIAHETAPGKFAILQTVRTQVGARTMGIDTKTHTIYLPTADQETLKGSAKGSPITKPGSFKVLTVLPSR